MYIELGKINGVWGVRGGVKVFSYTRVRDEISRYAIWYLLKLPSMLEDQPVDVDELVALAKKKGISLQKYSVKQCRTQGQNIVALFDEVQTREQAEQLNGSRVLVKKSELPILSNENYYWHELIGLSVQNENGVIGTVHSMIETGANDVMVISQEDGPEILLPYTETVVVSVCLDAAMIQVKWDPQWLS